MTEQVASRSSEMSPRRRITVASVLSSLSGSRSRLWMIGPPLVFGVLAALLGPHVEKRTFRAQAEVLISQVQAATPASPDPGLLTSEGRFMTTQASLARSPELAARVIAAAGIPTITPHQFLRHSSAKPQSDAAILNLFVLYPKAAAAVRLANAYAIEFTRYKSERDLAAINEALRQLRARIESFRAQGATGSPAYDALVEKQIELEAVRKLLSDEAKVLQPAEGASSFRPHALRNGIIGGLLGALLGIALVAVVSIWPRNSRSQAA